MTLICMKSISSFSAVGGASSLLTLALVPLALGGARGRAPRFLACSAATSPSLELGCCASARALSRCFTTVVRAADRHPPR